MSDFWTNDKIELLNRQYLQGCTPDECEIFLQQCKRTGLDPFARQIYAMRRWNKKARREEMFILVGIDGFRLIALKSEKYAGQVGPFWATPDGEWRDVWLSKTPPSAAKVGIMRHDFKEVCWGVATWHSYVQLNKEKKPFGNWVSMPDVMMAKVAEALGLRKAFPQDLSGLYTSEEMGQANNPTETVEISEQDKDNAAWVIKAFAETGVTQQMLEEHLKNTVGASMAKQAPHIRSLLEETRKGVPWEVLMGGQAPANQTQTSHLNAQFQ